MRTQYTVDQGDGRWLLIDNGRVLRSTPKDEIAFCYDEDSWVLFKHGDPDAVREYCRRMKSALGRVAKRSSDAEPKIAVLVAKSYPLVGDPSPGEFYLSVEEVNSCLNVTGYIERLVVRTSAIDIEAVPVTEPFIPTSKGPVLPENQTSRSPSQLRDFDVEICRTGYGVATARIQATSALEADQIAMEIAGDLEYSEKSSEYELANPAPIEKAGEGSPHVLRIYASINALDGHGATLYGLVHDINAERLDRLLSLERKLHELDLSELRFFSQPEEWITDEDRQDELDEFLDVPEAVITRGHISFVGYSSGGDRVMTTVEMDLNLIAECFAQGRDVYVCHEDRRHSDLLQFTDLNADDFIAGRKTMVISDRMSTQVVTPDQADVIFGHRAPSPVPRG